MKSQFDFEEIVETWLGGHLGILAHSQDLAESSHFVLACGNIEIEGLTWLDRFAAFLEVSKTQSVSLPHLQNPDGSWPRHPWQPLAYATLAGIHPNELAKTGFYSLRSIAEASVKLGDVQPEDFGHLTIAAVLLGFDRNFTVSIGQREYTLEKLVSECCSALESPVSYCWSFHLLESVLLAAFKLPLSQFQQQAEYSCTARIKNSFNLLNQQKMPLVELQANSLKDLSGKILEERRLRFLSLAAHTLELSGIYVRCGAKDAESIGLLGNKVIGLLETVFAGVEAHELAQRHWWIGPCAHLRRGLSLLRDSESLISKAVSFSNTLPISSSRYRDKAEFLEMEQQQRRFRHYSEDCSANIEAAPMEQQILSLISYSNWMVRRENCFIAFRPNHWPVYLHYEVQTDSKYCSAEIHLELERDRSLTQMFRQFGSELAQTVDGCTWDPYWAGCLGRICLSSKKSSSGTNIHNTVRHLLSLTFGPLEHLVKITSVSI